MSPLIFLYLFFAGTLISLYTNKRLVKFYKNKWIMYGFVLFSGLAANQLYDYYKSTPSEPEKVSFETQSILADNDTLYESTHGYVILIPKGYRYLAAVDPTASIYAEKKSDDKKNSNTITVSIIKAKGSLNEMMPDLTKKLKEKYSSFNYLETTNHSQDKLLRFTFKLNEDKNYGVMRFVVKDGLLYNLTAIAKNPPTDSFPEELESTIQSFRLK
ncbi:hypothetical protein DSN97_02345 [Deferribacteraceae bacterium V6Fe1]|nr:hypothetical protein DSN97_02345 [Deferribacteraceae bacterium V6Fe1]